jgi:hypothetical protein
MDNFRSATPLNLLSEYIQGFQKLSDVLHRIPKEVRDCEQIGKSFGKIEKDLAYYSRPDHWERLIEHVQKKFAFSMIEFISTINEAY